MRKWAEVFQKQGETTEQLAALDVTNEPDGGEQTMEELKTIYGTEATYRWHTCRHDDRGPCEIEVVT